eukprot:739662-Hanusia_phi.AAC.1
MAGHSSERPDGGRMLNRTRSRTQWDRTRTVPAPPRLARVWSSEHRPVTPSLRQSESLGEKNIPGLAPLITVPDHGGS